MPKGLTSASGIDAADPRPGGLRFDDGDRLHRRPGADGRARACSTTCPAAYDNGANDPEAREKMANASTMAGMAFANAFLGVCHSMAHKLGAFHHLPHGVANALMIDRRHPLQRRGGPAEDGYLPAVRLSAHPARATPRWPTIIGIKGKDDAEKVENLIKAIEELKKKIGIKEIDQGIRHRREGLPRPAGRDGRSRPSTTSARARTPATR